MCGEKYFWHKERIKTKRNSQTQLDYRSSFQEVFIYTSQKKRYKSWHWSCTFLKSKLLSIVGNNKYISGANMYILGPSMYILGGNMYILGTNMYILSVNMYILGANMYILGAMSISW